MKVFVSEECIRDGKPNLLENPIALALNRQHPVLRALWVGTLGHVWLRERPSRRLSLPPAARQLLVDFKAGKQVDELHFELSGSRENLARS